MIFFLFWFCFVCELVMWQMNTKKSVINDMQPLTIYDEIQFIRMF